MEPRMKVAKRQVPIPPGICTACFNAQQQYSFPFLVYCVHGETLAIMHSGAAHDSFHCLPEQLENVVERLEKLHPDLKSLRSKS